MPGKFIVIDGHDRAMLDRHSAALAGWLRDQGVRVFTTREPSDGPVGGQVRQVLNGRLKVAALPVPLLFLADRIDHLHREGDGILAHLVTGNWVVCTRYLLSALAYQGDLLPLDWLARINAPCPWPDIMVWCDSPGGGAVRQRFSEAADYYGSSGRTVLRLDGDDQSPLRATCARWLAEAQEAA